MTNQNYTLFNKYNLTETIMANIHKMPKFRKMKLSNNFLFNTAIEQILLIFLGLVTFLIRFMERKKTYFHLNLMEEDKD